MFLPAIPCRCKSNEQMLPALFQTLIIEPLYHNGTDGGTGKRFVCILSCKIKLLTE